MKLKFLWIAIIVYFTLSWGLNLEKKKLSLLFFCESLEKNYCLFLDLDFVALNLVKACIAAIYVGLSYFSLMKINCLGIKCSSPSLLSIIDYLI